LVEVLHKNELFTKNHVRAVFKQNGTVDLCNNNNILTVSNGIMSFRASSDYAPAIFSLEINGNEWLKTSYPTPSSFSWYNPFVGGIYTSISGFMQKLALKESCTTEFINVKDCFNNEWSGLKISYAIEKYDKLKGYLFEQYFLTQPGLPILCHFVKLINNTGLFINPRLITQIYPDFGKLSEGKTAKSQFADMLDIKQNLIMQGNSSFDSNYDKLAKLSCGRAENMYIYATEKIENCSISSDNQLSEIYASCRFSLPNNESYTKKPVFVILTDINLSAETLINLEKISF